MALRDQPYLPLYVKDFLTDEKLNECSANANGVYIRIMCIMHKAENYGKIRIRYLPTNLPQQNGQQKDQQHPQQKLWQVSDFAETLSVQLDKHLPYPKEKIKEGIIELLDEKVLHIEGDYLCQKRMIKDNALSLKRSKAGKKGADVTNRKKYGDNFAGDFAAAKTSANTAIEYEYENKSINVSNIPIPIINVFKKNNEELKKVYKDIGDFEIEKWRNFVAVCANDDDQFYTQIFTAKFVFPVQFKKLMEKGFQPPLWKPVLQKLCSVGLEPKHELWHRIPDAMGWLKKDIIQHAPEADNLTAEQKKLLYQEL